LQKNFMKLISKTLIYDDGFWYADYALEICSFVHWALNKNILLDFQ
jgi:hypothetical protein